MIDFLFTSFATFIVFALGASIGSFINVVVYRLPAKLSIVSPPSRCPRCLHRLGKWENIPVLGWLWLKGRCRHCKTPIAIRYPLVEAVTGLIFLLVFWRFGFSVQTVEYWIFCGWLLALSLIDLDTMTLPNSLTQSGLVVGLMFGVVASLIAQLPFNEVVHQLMLSVLGAVLGIWIFDAIAFFGSIVLGQAAMGAGDAKLAAMLGAWLGWKYLLLAGFLACAVGAFIGGGAIALGILSRRQKMPFGPFLALGALITIFSGEAILTAYFRLIFPAL
ncbi:A24 family peptidase [Gloeocapsopsis sp. IPPAS B-1203]|uniref:prepilin peptidase n=1 Tax=Gloeocapsopsis sp. IPPAS B-1203 TaxID=2049454 RepID=UPI000C19976A|nr:A24 family peptidase [Gloeocapsopsis sp. IPPAS B-1203]PIG92166.1 prepilin peptidase [Gloeocapsopsis sp. IPPAS B-1203]